MPGKGKKGSGNRVKYKEGADEIGETYSNDDYNRTYKEYNYSNNSGINEDAWNSNWDRNRYYAPDSNSFGSGTGGYGSGSSSYGSGSSGYGSSTGTSSYNPSGSYGSGSISRGLEYWQNIGKKGGSKKTRRKTTKRRKTNKRRK